MSDQYSKKVCDLQIDQDQALDGTDIDQKQFNTRPNGTRKAPAPAEPERHKQQTHLQSVRMSELARDIDGGIARPFSIKNDPSNRNFEAHDDDISLGVTDTVEGFMQGTKDAYEHCRRGANGEDFHVQITITNLPDRDTQSTEAPTTTQPHTQRDLRWTRPTIVGSDQDISKTQQHQGTDGKSKKSLEELDRDLKDYFKHGPTEP